MTVYTIQKDFHFCASHQLRYLAETQPDHKCARLHGHNYVVRVTLGSRVLGEDQFVVDYAVLQDFKEVIDREFDHRDLNQELDVSGRATTAENLAALFYATLEDLLVEQLQTRFTTSPQSEGSVCWIESVSVSETPKTWATFYGRQPSGS